ncbi:3-hydroxyacyl-ACP dehydratase [uncultured Chitinophaga sp.]|jgi:Predicted 3-hydroxylacyl-(acyl carrier protein) dehydratase|uniref:3-hydroxyacyl-ACP dehydratase n=1 Tax=uncultured Chitinophaga sp. TaxID=339340 RepID=UPI00262C2152|nr:3-hydroxyacyl-ACP dehydratase [uncultured Chitinophaga sp.]
MFIHTDDITAFIPQRSPFVMIGGILAAEGRTVRSGLHISPDNIFVQDGVLTPPGLMENIAQTAAARAGWLASQESKPISLGYIGAVKDLEIFELPPVGAFIETVAEIGQQVLNATMVTGQVMLDGKLIAQCEMKIFISA